MKKWLTVFFVAVVTAGTGCRVPKQALLPQIEPLPARFTSDTGTVDAPVQAFWYNDPTLQKLIDTALVRNLDLQAALQRIHLARASTRVAGALLRPQVSAVAGVSVDRYGKYTLNGVGNYDTNLSPNISKDQKIPTSPTPDFFLGFRSSWEVDFWGKLKSRRRAALARFLASEKGRQWLATQVVADVAGLYYDLQALDRQLRIVQKNIELQQRGLDIVEAQMAGGRATALAVRQFRAQVLHTREVELQLRQSIVQTENALNTLLGRYVTPVERDSLRFAAALPEAGAVFSPQLLLRRPDIQQAELELEAARADVHAARKALLPSLSLDPYVGFNAFKAPLLFSGASLAVGAASALSTPLLNRAALLAGVDMANAEQAAAFYQYQKLLVQGYNEVVTHISALENQKKAYALKQQEVEALSEGVATANDLYLAGYASYLEVIVAQGSVLQAEMEQVNIRRDMYRSRINLYRSLGGGMR